MIDEEELPPMPSWMESFVISETEEVLISSLPLEASLDILAVDCFHVAPILEYKLIHPELQASIKLQWPR